jgi:hypothetical protein
VRLAAAETLLPSEMHLRPEDVQLTAPERLLHVEEACQIAALSKFECKHFSPKMRPKMAGSPRGRYRQAALTGRRHAASGLKQAQNIQWLYRG